MISGYMALSLIAEWRVVRRMHMGSWERVPRYGHIRSRHIEWSTHRGAKGLVRVMINDLINKYADDSPSQEGCPPHAEVGITMYWRI